VVVAIKLGNRSVGGMFKLGGHEVPRGRQRMLIRTIIIA
jgi:hypothetical protein